MTGSSFFIDSTEFQILPAEVLLESVESITVHSLLGDYSVDFCTNDRSPNQTIFDLAADHDALLIIDAKVLATHFAVPLPFDEQSILALDATESTKTLEGVVKVLDFLTEHSTSRDRLLIVVGGGIIQDTVGFSCGIYKRGMPWLFVPTTLLAQSDSCIGSKTGINYGRTKNLLGSFFAPKRVVLHPGFLQTLTQLDLLSGLSEVFKLCITAGPEYLDAFDRLLPLAVSHDVEILRRLARLAISIKHPVIEADELDRDLRRALNFGHSIGHAIEIVTDHSVAHGLAICFGLLVESSIAQEQGILESRDFLRMLRSASTLFTKETVDALASVQPGELRDILSRDKKASRSSLVLPLPQTFGRMEFFSFPLDESFDAQLARSYQAVLDCV